MDKENATSKGQLPSKTFEAEQRRLSSNLPLGLAETMPDPGSARVRLPTVSAARITYQATLESFKLQLNDLFEPDPSNDGLPIRKERLQESYDKVQEKFENLQDKAMQLRSTLSREGASSEAVQIDNEIVALQSEIVAFRQLKAPEIQSESQSISKGRIDAGSICSGRSLRSHASSTSSNRKLRLAELERKRWKTNMRREQLSYSCNRKSRLNRLNCKPRNKQKRLRC